MKNPPPAACLSLRLLRYVRDERPTAAELLEWLGPSDVGRYHVLRKAGLLQEREGRIALSSEHLSADGRRFLYGIALYWLDEDRIDYLVVTG